MMPTAALSVLVKTGYMRDLHKATENTNVLVTRKINDSLRDLAVKLLQEEKKERQNLLKPTRLRVS